MTLRKLLNEISIEKRWEAILLIGFAGLACFLAFYNVKYSPRPRHDEGAVLILAKTLAEDGIYAGRNSDGYQTFGAVQSVGPTVVLPIAISFKFFGVGLMQARIVIGIYLLLTLAVFYLLGRSIFNNWIALIACGFLLGSPVSQYLFYGRQVLGEIPALGFFLGGWLFFIHAARTGKTGLLPISGVLFGAAIITKNQYLITTVGSLIVLLLLDLVYYRLGYHRKIIVVLLFAVASETLWLFWQMIYFGLDTFQANLGKLGELAGDTTGLRLSTSIFALKFIFGSESGYFYYFWGFPALSYSVVLSARRAVEGYELAFLALASLLGLAYYILWANPWTGYMVAPGAILALFLGKFWFELLDRFRFRVSEFWKEVQQKSPGRDVLSLLALATLVLMMAVQLQKQVRLSVFTVDNGPYEMAAFLNENIPQDVVIETWERELGIMTGHQYHYPDQLLYGPALRAIWRGGPKDFILGSDYFKQSWPAYVIVGGHAKWTAIYNMDFIQKSSCWVASFGEGEWTYDLYRFGPMPGVPIDCSNR